MKLKKIGNIKEKNHTTLQDQNKFLQLFSCAYYFIWHIKTEAGNTLVRKMS